ncbi:MAG: hypothetical protein ACK4IT_05970 [Thioalkalivibrionaceae bacterium]
MPLERSFLDRAERSINPASKARGLAVEAFEINVFEIGALSADAAHNLMANGASVLSLDLVFVLWRSSFGILLAVCPFVRSDARGVLSGITDGWCAFMRSAGRSASLHRASGIGHRASGIGHRARHGTGVAA